MIAKKIKRACSAGDSQDQLQWRLQYELAMPCLQEHVGHPVGKVNHLEV